MKLVPYHNTGRHAVHIGSKTIAPGETRAVDESLLDFRREAKAAAPADPLRNLAEETAAIVIKAIGEGSLSDEDLERLEAIETEGKQRKGVLAALAEERLAREKAAIEGGDGKGGAE